MYPSLFVLFFAYLGGGLLLDLFYIKYEKYASFYLYLHNM